MPEPTTHETTPSKRWRVLGVVLSVVVALGAVVVWRVSVARNAFDPLAMPDAIPAALRTAQRTREDAWRQASFVRIPSGATRSLSGLRAQAAEIATRLDPMVEDPDHLLTPASRRALLEEIAIEALVRTQTDPDAYIALTKSTPEYRWIEANEARWRRAGLWTLLESSGGAKPATTLEACRRLWPETMEAGYRFAAIGVAPTGARIKIGLIRSSHQPFDLGEQYTEGQQHYWLDVPMRSSTFKFREAATPLDDALGSRDSLVIAESNLLVETDNALLATWRWFWYLDPGSGRWVCHYDVVAGGRLVRTFF